MGYSYYEIARPDGRPMKRGYGVSCRCHARGCKEQIDRGMAFLCYSCTWYFCSDHRTWAFDDIDQPIKYECFAGESNEVCYRCAEKKPAARGKATNRANSPPRTGRVCRARSYDARRRGRSWKRTPGSQPWADFTMKRRRKPKPERLTFTVAERRRLYRRARKIKVADNTHFFKIHYGRGEKSE